MVILSSRPIAMLGTKDLAPIAGTGLQHEIWKLSGFVSELVTSPFQRNNATSCIAPCKKMQGNAVLTHSTKLMSSGGTHQHSWSGGECTFSSEGSLASMDDLKLKPHFLCIRRSASLLTELEGLLYSSFVLLTNSPVSFYSLVLQYMCVFIIMYTDVKHNVYWCQSVPTVMACWWSETDTSDRYG